MKKLIVLLLIFNCLLITPSVYAQKIQLDLKSLSLDNEVYKSVDTVYVSELVSVQENPPVTSYDSSFIAQRILSVTFKTTAYKIEKWRERRKNMDTNDSELKALEARRKRIDAEIEERKSKLNKQKNDKIKNLD